MGGSVASERSVGCESNGRDGKKRFDFTRKMMEGEIMIVFFCVLCWFFLFTEVKEGGGGVGGWMGGGPGERTGQLDVEFDF